MQKWILCLLFLGLSIQLKAALPQNAREVPDIQLIDRYYQKGDTFLEVAQIDSAIFYYLQAREVINTVFFQLVLDKKARQLSRESITQQWESILAKMRIKLTGIQDCQFERCYIYREEKAANYCILLINKGDKLQIEKLIRLLIGMIQFDANAQLKNFFGKIFHYLQLNIRLKRFHEALFPNQLLKNDDENLYRDFIKAYLEYKTQISQTNS
ncbi:hypothetical protein JW964_13405 [candidate division KSB1 bacterium]|nr:hypothetical protein [candidate division KSB1 bacterium]